ncbi:putative oxidoreductase C-terminal domain-containing protein [soil metagenome]
MKKSKLAPLAALAVFYLLSCTPTKQEESEKTMAFTGATGEVKLMTVDPGHFHAALVQKTMYDQVHPTVHVYAPDAADVQDHLNRLEGYNQRAESPTAWQMEVYKGPDFFERMLQQKPGNVVVLAGNNQKKTDYIKASVEAGLHVLADKPMAIDTDDFAQLQEAFALAERNNVLLYDIMTERFEISTLLQKEFSQLPAVFGQLQKGTPEDPAVTKESVHHVFKFVSGSPIKRPAWFFDVTQQGEGIVDVTTHLVDLVQWACFPEQKINFQNDIRITNARRWPTPLTPAQFRRVTHLSAHPAYLAPSLGPDSVLSVFSNGEINYALKGVHAKVSVIWNYEAPEGAGDTHFSVMKGSKANLVIRQGKEQQYKPELYIEPVPGTNLVTFEQEVRTGVGTLAAKYPGVSVERQGNSWRVLIPAEYHNGHEAHFGQVTERFLQYLTAGKLPDWEVPNMLAKYYTTTRALEIAKQSQPK